MQQEPGLTGDPSAAPIPTAAPGPGRLARLVPAVDWLGHYRRAWLRGDVVAALTTWALVVPQSIAYAQIADLPPQAGLFATFAGLLGYALLGSSRQLIVSPTSSTAAITAALVAPVAAGDVARFGALAAVLAVLVGLVLALLGVLHMGFVSRFISAGVQAGFMFGLGLTIIVGQVPKLLGVPGGEGDFFPQLGHLLTRLDDANPWTAAVGLGSLALLLAARRVVPTLPAALGVVVAGIAVVALFGLADRGVEVIGRVEGAVPALVLPAVGWHDLVALLPGALAIAVIGYAESATVAESLADEHGYSVRPDRELVAIGGANVLAGLFQGFITGGGASQSAANDRAGAQTQLVSLLVSGLTVLTAVALLPLFRDLPQAVLGAIVIGAVAGFLNLPALRRIARLRRDSFALAMVALAGVLVFGVLGGLLLAVVISILLLLDHESRPGDTVRTEPGLLVFRLDAALLFLNAKLVRERIRVLLEATGVPVRIVLLDLRFTHDLDVETVNVLAALRAELAQRGWSCGSATCAPASTGGCAAAAWPTPSARPPCTATWPTPAPTSAPPSTPDRQRDGWVRAKNSSALRVLGSWGPVALRPWPCTHLTAPAYTSSTFWGVALVDSSTSGTWPG